MAVNLAPAYVTLKITSTLNSFASERKFLTSTTVKDLKVWQLFTVGTGYTGMDSSHPLSRSFSFLDDFLSFPCFPSLLFD